MKKVLLSLLAVLFMATVICCNESENPVVNVTLKNFANSGCKSNTKAGDENRAAFIEYSVIHNDYLYLNHQNVMFNCCPGELGANISVDENIITINEYETEQSCKCICPYDLSYEIGPLKEGETYTLFIRQNENDNKPITRKFEFKNSMSGVWK